MTPSVLLVTLKMQAFWVCPMATSLGEVNPRWCVTRGWSRAGVWIHHVTIDRYVIYTDTLTPGVRDLGLAQKGLPFWGRQRQFTQTTHAAKVDRFQCQTCQFSFQLHLKGLWIPKTLRTDPTWASSPFQDTHPWFPRGPVASPNGRPRWRPPQAPRKRSWPQKLPMDDWRLGGLGKVGYGWNQVLGLEVMGIRGGHELGRCHQKIVLQTSRRL